MKKIVSAIAALALAVPSIASAAAPAQALSVKSAAVKPVRASAQRGDNKAISKPLLIVAIIGLAGAVWAIADSR